MVGGYCPCCGVMTGQPDGSGSYCGQCTFEESQYCEKCDLCPQHCIDNSDDIRERDKDVPTDNS